MQNTVNSNEKLLGYATEVPNELLPLKTLRLGEAVYIDNTLYFPMYVDKYEYIKHYTRRSEVPYWFNTL